LSSSAAGATLVNNLKVDRKPQPAQHFGQNGPPNPAPFLTHPSFPQAIAAVCEADATTAKKIQDIVVCC
jgi:hypothetical protein